MSKLNPLHDNVIVKRSKSEEKTEGGLFIPTTVAEKSTYAEVLAVGRGAITSNGTLVPVSVKPGDHVLLEKNRGVEVVVDGETYLMVKERDIIGIVE
jgi:chaperonin GroES